MPQAAPAHAPPHPAVALLAREMRVRRGEAPGAIGGQEVARNEFLLTGDIYLMRADDGIAIHYRRGAGLTLDAPADADPRDIDLWLNGSVYAAVAAINGLLPIHASAVAWNGRVYAFSGPPGAGKSTLAAGRAGSPASVCASPITAPPPKPVRRPRSCAGSRAEFSGHSAPDWL